MEKLNLSELLDDSSSRKSFSEDDCPIATPVNPSYMIKK